MVFKYAQLTLNLFSEWWGKLEESKPFSIIEIPSGYGSQADVTCILQTSDAFNDSTNLRQLYHEISHLWNVKSNDIYFPRWNEGLATFIEYLTIEKLENRPYLDYVTDWFLKQVRKELESDSILNKTPMIDFGKMGIQSNSYTVGMIMFRVLYQIIGENDFNKCIRTYYSTYYFKGATTDEFVATAKKVSTKKLSKFFDDWIYSTKYTELIKKGLTVNEMCNLYSSGE
jgi:aminopeptidase N